MPTKDPCSFANTDDFILKHVSLDWTIDFDQKIINGSALLRFDVRNKSSGLVVTISFINLVVLE